MLFVSVSKDHWNNLHYPMSSSLKDRNIHDTSVKPLRQNGGFFTHPEHLGFSLLTDSVPVFESSLDSL